MKRILVVRCGALGDLVYATSVIDALKMQFGEDTVVDFVCTPSSGTLFRDDPRVEKVFPLKHKKIPLLFSKEKKAIVEASKKEPYDILINFEYGKQFCSLLEHIVAKEKVGANLTKLKISPNAIHSVDIIKQMYKTVVSQDILLKSYPRVIGTANETVRKKYQLPNSFIIISPSNSHQKRNRLNYRAWENESWKTLIQEVAKRSNVVLIGGANEENFFSKLLPYPDGTIDLVGKTSISELIGVIDAADALVATDTGTAHLASALNTDVFALIGPTPADVTGPYKTPNNNVCIISANLECSPCYKTEVMKNCKENICMKQITPQMVLDALYKDCP